MHRTVSLTALGFIIASPALAGGLVEPAPEPVVEAPVVVAPPAPAFSFAGPYVGVGIGTGTFDLEGDEDQAEEFFEAIEDDDSAAYYQLHAGYNFVRNNFVFGPEVALFNGESEVSQDDITIGDDTDNADAEVDLGARLMGRAGYQFGRVMPYLTAGLTYLEIEADGDDLSDTGFAVGVGADVLVTEQFMVGVEYMQNDFDEFDDSEANVDYETIALRGSFRF